MHALSRILARRSTGEYSNIHNVHKRLHSYEILRRQYVRRRDYQDIAYVDGYLNGVSFLLADHPARRVLPLLYVFGADQQPFTKDEYRKLLKKAESTHRSAYRACRGIVENTDLRVGGVVVHHPPFLSYEKAGH